MNDEKNLDFIYDVISKKLDRLYDSTDALDNKIAVWLGFQAAILSALVGWFRDEIELYAWPLAANSFAIGVILLVISLSLTIYSIITRNFSDPPAINQLCSDKSVNSSTVDLKNQTIADMKEAYSENLFVHERKGGLFNYSATVGFIGLLYIVIYFMI